jgi:hypothetical protein
MFRRFLMKRYLLISAVILIASTAPLSGYTQVASSGSPQAPVCTAKTMVIENATASDYIESLEMTPLTSGDCSAPGNSRLTITEVSAPGRLKPGNVVVVPYPKAEQTVSVAYTVGNEDGATMQGSITLQRK